LNISPDAAIIGAVETVRRNGDRLIGENTDGKGFLREVRQDVGMDPKGKRVVVLGAGAVDVLVVNRSVTRGEQMVADLASKTKARVTSRVCSSALALPIR
jgi:hypothetical protein